LNQADDRDESKQISRLEDAARFSPPEFINAELAQKLFERGKAERLFSNLRSARNIGAVLFLETLLAVVAFYLHTPPTVLWTLAVAVAFVMLQVLHVIKFKPIEKAFKNRQFVRVTRLLPDAYRSFLVFYPLTFFHTYFLSLRSVHAVIVVVRAASHECSCSVSSQNQ
jgi:hypothetical protein